MIRLEDIKPGLPLTGFEPAVIGTLRYLYLPRLKSRGVLEQAIIKEAGTRDFFVTAYGEFEGKFDGFKFGDANVQLDDTILLIEPEAAAAYAQSLTPPTATPGVGASLTPPPGLGTPAGQAPSVTPGLPGMGGGVRVSVEIQANFPNGAKDQTKRAVSENARTLSFKNADCE